MGGFVAQDPGYVNTNKPTTSTPPTPTPHHQYSLDIQNTILCVENISPTVFFGKIFQKV